MTPVEELRAAATLMRERAQAATPGPWSSDPTGTVCADADLKPDGQGGEILPQGGPMEVAECYRNERAGERGANAAHIAAADPPTMLEVANWLTMHAADLERANGLIGACDSPADTTKALAVARAYLGEAMS